MLLKDSTYSATLIQWSACFILLHFRHDENLPGEHVRDHLKLYKHRSSTSACWKKRNKKNKPGVLSNVSHCFQLMRRSCMSKITNSFCLPQPKKSGSFCVTSFMLKTIESPKWSWSLCLWDSFSDALQLYILISVHVIITRIVFWELTVYLYVFLKTPIDMKIVVLEWRNPQITSDTEHSQLIPALEGRSMATDCYFPLRHKRSTPLRIVAKSVTPT